MSKILTIANKDDDSEIFNCIKLLAKAHGEDAESFDMSKDRFINAFNKTFFSVHLYKEIPQEINGFVLHMKEYSLKFNGFGAYLDDLYLDPSCRGKGFGRKVLAELCEYLLNNNQTYIKIIFQKNLALDNFYKHFGFVNYSDDLSLYLFEGNRDDFCNVLSALDDQPNEIVSHKIQKENAFPIFEIVVTRDLQTYTFCCQFYFNSWNGFGILFSDFCGDTSIARLSDFRRSCETILSESGWSEATIKVLWWQVSADQKQLAGCIESCFAENIYRDGWKISYLNEDGMRKLSRSVDIK